MSDTDGKIAIESVTSPRHTQRVDRAKYMSVRDALLAVLQLTSRSGFADSGHTSWESLEDFAGTQTR